MKKKIFILISLIFIESCTIFPFCLNQRSDWISNVIFSKDNKYLFSASQDIRVWDIEKGNKIGEISGQTFKSASKYDKKNCDYASGFWSIAIAPDEKNFATGNFDNSVTIWNIKNRTKIITINIIPEEYSSINVLYSPNGKYLAVVMGFDNTIKIFDTQTWKEINTLKSNFGYGLRDFTFDPASKYFFAGGIDEKGSNIIVWDYISGKEIYRISSNQSVNALRISPDGKYLVSAGITNEDTLFNSERENVIRVRELNNKELVSEIKIKYIREDINDMDFSNNGKFLAVATSEGLVRIYNVSDWSENKVIIVNEEKNNSDYKFIHSVSFSNDGNFLASGGRNSLVKIFDVKNNFKLMKKLE